MIGSVRGTVLERSTSGEVLVEVGGVGYRVLVPLGAIPALEPGSRAFLFTHLHVREDAMVLYGFTARDERDTFEILITASGVGPKMALAILSVHSPAALRRALADDDIDALTLVPGVGKRTAQKLMVELSSRLDVPDIDLTSKDSAVPTVRSEVREALLGLGYGAEEIRSVLSEVQKSGGDEETAPDLLRSALKRLAAPR